MQFILPTLYALVFILLIFRIKFFELEGFSKKTVAGVFLIKIAAGFSVWWVYTYYYPGGDMQNYFNDGNKLYSLLNENTKAFYDVVFNNAPYNQLHIWNSSFESTLYNDARTMSLLNMGFRFFSFGNFYVHIVFICFLSFIGLIALYKTFVKFLLKQKNKLFISIFFIPSLLFWGSGVLKEGLLIFGLGVFLYTVNCGLRTSYSAKKVLFILISIAVLLLIKFYILLALLPGLCLNVIINKTSERFLLVKLSVVLIALASIVLLVTFINKDYNPAIIIKDKQVKAILEARGGAYLANDKRVIAINYDKRDEQLKLITDSSYKITLGSNYIYWKANDMSVFDSVKNSTDTSTYKLVYTVVPANSILSIDFINSNFSNLFAVLPQALFNAFLEPLVWNAKGVIQLIPAIENVVFVILIILSLVYFNKNFRNKSVVFFCLSFVIILFVLVGITTPALGAIVRYKAPGLPFLLIALLLITYREKEV